MDIASGRRLVWFRTLAFQANDPGFKSRRPHHDFFLTNCLCLFPKLVGKSRNSTLNKFYFMKCRDCGQEILQAKPQICPYCRSKNLISEEDASKDIQEAERLAKTGRYEDAALKYEKLDLWDKAKECRRLNKKKGGGSADLPIGKVGAVSMVCPHCGTSQPLNLKLNQETCSRCGTIYMIPSQVLELISVDEER